VKPGAMSLTARRTPENFTRGVACEQVAAPGLVVPQRVVQFPAVTAIVTDKQATGNSTGVQPAGLVFRAEGNVPDFIDGSVGVLGLTNWCLRVEIGRGQVLLDVTSALWVFD